jgi:hypothetical protein
MVAAELDKLVLEGLQNGIEGVNRGLVRLVRGVELYCFFCRHGCLLFTAPTRGLVRAYMPVRRSMARSHDVDPPGGCLVFETWKSLSIPNEAAHRIHQSIGTACVGSAMCCAVQICDGGGWLHKPRYMGLRHIRRLRGCSFSIPGI